MRLIESLRFSIVAFATASCTHASWHVELASMTRAVASGAHTESDQVPMCLTPKRIAPAMVDNRGMGDVLLERCDVFRRYFDDTFAGACGALPGIARVLDEQGDERARALAALPLVPAQCRARFPEDLHGVDTSKRATEDASWQSCTADDNIATTYSRDLARVPHAYVSLGLHLFAVGISNRLTPLGQQYLRKYVVCEALAATAQRDPEVRAAYADVLFTSKEGP
jgi:hypothetical protein